MLVASILTPQIGIVTECLRHRELAGRPLALSLGTEVVALSPEAAAAAIRPGEKVSGARHRCPELTVLPYDEPCYKAAAEPLWDALAIETSTVEPVSPECTYAEFENRSALSRLGDLLAKLAKQFPTPVQAGLALTKLVATQAARQAQPASLHVVPSSDQLSFLAPLSLSHFDQIDGETRRRLRDLGIYTLGDLQRVPACDLEKQFGYRSIRLAALAQGKDGDFVNARWPMPGIQESFRFDEIDGLADENIEQRFVEHALRCCTERIALRLERERLRTKRIELQITLRKGDHLDLTERLEMVISDPKLLFACALRLLNRLELSSPPDRLTVTATELGAGSGIQLGMMDERGRDMEQVRRLNNTLKTVRRKFGPEALSEGLPNPPRGSTLFASPMTHRRVEPIDVTLDQQGYPVQMARFNLRGDCWQTPVQVYDHWVETKWLAGEAQNCQIFRAQSDNGSFFEISQLARGEWRLTAIAD